MTHLAELAPGLVELTPGLFGTRDATSVSYPEDGHDGCCAVEDASFWFAHRNAVILQALDAYPPGGLLLDVGGGNGYVTRALAAAGHAAVLLEPGPAGVANARARGVAPIIQGTLEAARLRPSSLPSAGLFDVVEHVADDVAFLRELGATLVPGGRLYVTVPAFTWLWSHADTHAGHYRRYTRATLHAALEASGFTVERATCFFAFLAAPILLGRTLPDRFRPPARDRQRQSEREHQHPAAVRAAVDAVSRSELAWLGRGGVLPVGSSLLAVARRRA